MPRQFLDRTSRRAAHRQVRAERMPQHVNAVARHARPPRRPTNGAVQDHLRERLPVGLTRTIHELSDIYRRATNSNVVI
jgi:hypothetical protein